MSISSASLKATDSFSMSACCPRRTAQGVSPTFCTPVTTTCVAPAATTRRTCAASAWPAAFTVAVVWSEMPVAFTAATMSCRPPLSIITSPSCMLVRASNWSTCSFTLGAAVPLLVSAESTRA